MTNPLHARMFQSVRLHRNYRLFFSGQMVSQIGSWIQKVAQAWFVLDLTHSGRALGVLVACQFAPYAVFGLFGGALSDRLDNHRALIGTQAAQMGTAGVMAAFAFAGSLTVPETDVIAAIQGLVLVLDTPIRQAFVVQMVGREELPNAIALNVSLFNAARILGPVLGGLAIAGVGVRVCFLVNALSYLPVLAGLMAMRRGDLHQPSRVLQTSAKAVLRSTGEGLRMAWRIPAVLIIMMMIIVVATLGNNFNVALPILTRDTLHTGSTGLGLLLACYGTGALCGALAVASIGRASWAVLLASCGLLGTLELLLATQTTTIGFAAILVCAGVTFSCFTSSANATLQLHVPDDFRTRILALYSYAWIGTSPLSGLLAGWLTQSGGVALIFGIGGSAVISATVLALALRLIGLRRNPRHARNVRRARGYGQDLPMARPPARLLPEGPVRAYDRMPAAEEHRQLAGVRASS
ncbi:MAG TPA: MFS transporter [Streptosporangiaceae bacterium]|nr:MFS transporter [Streptosporangiaceae bacterium]